MVFDGQIFQKTVVVWWFCFPGEESALSATGSRLYAHCLTKIICMNTLDLLLSDKQWKWYMPWNSLRSVGIIWAIFYNFRGEEGRFYQILFFRGNKDPSIIFRSIALLCLCCCIRTIRRYIKSHIARQTSPQTITKSRRLILTTW